MATRNWSRRDWLRLAGVAGIAGSIEVSQITGSSGITGILPVCFAKTALAGGGVVSYCSLTDGKPGSSPELEYRIGIWTRCWDPAPWEQALDEAVAAGYTNVGLMTHDHWKPVMTFDMPFEKAEKLRNAGVQRGLRFPAAFCPGFGLDPAKFDVGVAGLRRMLDLCVTAGVSMVLLGGTSEATLQDIYYQTVLECCDYAQERGILMTVKPHGGLNATSAQCAAVVRLVGHPAFRLCYDPGNVYFYSDGALDPKTDVEDAKGLVSAVCIKDFLPPKNVDVTPGDGKVDFATVFQSLREGGFLSGDLMIETVQITDSMEDRRREAIRARQFVSKLVASLPPM